MKIKKNNRTLFAFPTFLIFNTFTSRVFKGKLKEEGISLTGKQLRAIIKEGRLYKRTHPDWNIVEIETECGDVLTIKI